MTKELAKQVEKIKRLVENDQAELAIELVRTLDDPKICEALLEGCSIDEDGVPQLPAWLVDNDAERDQRPFFFELLATSPTDAAIDPSLLRENLTELNLAGCSSLKNVAGLSGLTNLTRLNLDECESLANVDALANLTGLTQLSLNGCESLDPKAVKKLKKALPNC